MNISVIDVEDEYARFIQAIGGQRIELTADSLHINPLELQTGGQTFREKIASLVGFLALLPGDNGEMTRHESAVVEQCLLQAYALRGITADPVTHTRPAPLMQELAQALQREASGHNLALRLTASLHLFPRRSSFKQDNKHTVYSLRALPETLRPVATYLIAARLCSQLQAARQETDGTPPQRHISMINEAWFLTKYNAEITLLNDLARRGPKYSGNCG